MSRLWVVECKFRDGNWDIAHFSAINFASANFYEAHLLKRQIYAYLHAQYPYWAQRHFRVREYVQGEAPK